MGAVPDYVIYFFGPVGLLVVVGYPLSGYLRYRAARPSSRRETLEVGLSLAPGYLVLAVYGILLTVVGGPFVGGSWEILLAGVAYPVVWGGIGAVIGVRRLVAGSVLGAAAYLLNYGVTYLFLALDGATWREAWGARTEPNLMSKFVGQTFYNAHFVGTRVETDALTVSIRNYVTDASLQEAVTSTVPGVVYLLAPICVLVVAGYILSRVGRLSSRTAALGIGLGLVPGYLALAIPGVQFFHIGGPFTSSMPNPVPAMFLATVAYPVLWGGIGAVIGYELHADGEPAVSAVGS